MQPLFGKEMEEEATEGNDPFTEEEWAELIPRAPESVRLEREVIEAAKEWRKDTIVDEPLKDVVDALIEFESQWATKGGIRG